MLDKRAGMSNTRNTATEVLQVPTDSADMSWASHRRRGGGYWSGYGKKASERGHSLSLRGQTPELIETRETRKNTSGGTLAEEGDDGTGQTERK